MTRELAALMTRGHRSVVVFDTETTGLFGDVRLVEVAVVDLETGKILLDTKVQPATKEEQRDGGFHIPESATQIHNIRDSDVVDAPDFAQIRGMLSRVFQKVSFVVGYNVSYDLGVLLNHNLRYFGKSYPYPMLVPPAIDVMGAYAQRYGEWSEYHGSYTWVKLAEAARACGYDLVDAHGALADTLATRAIALYLLRQESISE